MEKRITRKNTFKYVFRAGTRNRKHFQALVNSLPEDVKNEYLKEYKRMKKDEGLATLFHILGLSYAYFGEWGKQLLFLITWGGAGLWWFINFFRLSGKTERANLKLARELFTHLRTKYDLNSKTQSKPRPRPLNFTYDAVDLKPNNLKIDFLIDYRLETWFVVGERQYDWNNNQTDRDFQLSNKKDTILNLYIENSTRNMSYYVGYEISVQLLIPNLESLILRDNPPSNLVYGTENYYLETTKNGWLFKKTGQDTSNQVTAWQYFNPNHTKAIRIEWIDGQYFKAWTTLREEEFAFSNILPYS